MLRALVVAYTLLIVLLAVLPVNNGEKLDDVFILHVRGDYLVHFALFVPYMVLIAFYTRLSFRASPLSVLGWISAGLLLAVGTEAIQYFLPYRAFNINDMAANAAGVMLGSLVFLRRK